jgi:hypothetical protein
MFREKFARYTTAVAAVALLMPAAGSAQSWDYINPIPAGTSLQVRTTEPIDTQSMDGRIFTGTLENDVRDTQGRMAIPSGATAELVVRRDADNDLVLDLDSVTVNGRRYGVDATRNRVVVTASISAIAAWRKQRRRATSAAARCSVHFLAR